MVPGELCRFPDEIAKRCLLIYSAASLPSDDESSRIVMSNQLSSIEPTTHLYRRYVHEILERLHSNVHEIDWLLLSLSQILSELLASCGHDAAWAKPLAWETYASTRYDALREQLRSLLDAARRHSSRPPLDTEGWFAQGDKIWVRVGGTNTFGHPDFEWRDLPTYMLHEHESRAAEFVLDTRAVERLPRREAHRPTLALPSVAPALAVDRASAVLEYHAIGQTTVSPMAGRRPGDACRRTCDHRRVHRSRGSRPPR